VTHKGPGQDLMQIKSLILSWKQVCRKYRFHLDIARFFRG